MYHSDTGDGAGINARMHNLLNQFEGDGCGGLANFIHTPKTLRYN